MSSRLLSPAWLQWPETQYLIKAFAAHNAPLRFVGGAVRDALLRIEVQDVDAATTLPPKTVLALLTAAKIQALPIGIAHGTITAIINGKHFEITTLRKDVSTDGRWAKVEYTDNWEEDAARRDFTMNAMYLSPAGELFDYFGGENDARNGRVRFIGEPAQRIEEDYLRILRFFRFHAHYGAGDPDEEAVTACANDAKCMKKLSGERIQHEMLKLLSAPRPAATIALMNDREILHHVLAYDVRDTAMLERLEKIEDVLRQHPPASVRLSTLLLGLGSHMTHDEAIKKITKRWRLSNELVSELHMLTDHVAAFDPELTEHEQKRVIRKLGTDHFGHALLVAWAYGKEPISDRHAYAGMLEFSSEWVIPPFPVTGKDLIALGIKPGKKMGQLLAALEDSWERSDYTMDKETLLKKAQTLAG